MSRLIFSEGHIKHAMGYMTALLTGSHAVVRADSTSDGRVANLVLINISQAKQGLNETQQLTVPQRNVERLVPFVLRNTLPTEWKKSEPPIGVAFRSSVRIETVKWLLSRPDTHSIILLSGHANLGNAVEKLLNAGLNQEQKARVQSLTVGAESSTVKKITQMLGALCSENDVTSENVRYRLTDMQNSTGPSSESHRPYTSPPLSIKMPDRKLKIPDADAVLDRQEPFTLLFAFDTCVIVRAKAVEPNAGFPGCMKDTIATLRRRGVKPIFMDLTMIRNEVGIPTRGQDYNGDECGRQWSSDTMLTQSFSALDLQPDRPRSEAVYSRLLADIMDTGIPIRVEPEREYLVDSFELRLHLESVKACKDIWGRLSSLWAHSQQDTTGFDDTIELIHRHEGAIEPWEDLHSRSENMLERLRILVKDADTGIQPDISLLISAMETLFTEQMVQRTAQKDDRIQLSCSALATDTAVKSGEPVVAVLISIDQDVGLCCSTALPDFFVSPIMSQSVAAVPGQGAFIAGTKKRDSCAWGGFWDWNLKATDGARLADLFMAVAAPLVAQQRGLSQKAE